MVTTNFGPKVEMQPFLRMRNKMVQNVTIVQTATVKAAQCQATVGLGMTPHLPTF